MLAWLTLAVATIFSDVYKKDVPEVLAAIALASEADPLFNDAKRTAALLASIAWHESRFRIDAKGTRGDCGAFQHVTQDKDECAKLRSDVLYAAQVAIKDVRMYGKACGPERLLNMYATGSCDKGQRVTDSRKARAAQLLRVKVPE